MTLTLGELFAGYGGLGAAVEEVFNARLAWYAEFDPSASKIMAHHWPDLTNYGDVTAVDWGTVPPVDIISGGSPCQDLSLAGARRGMTEGTRSNLWESMREAIATIQPTYVVWENVRGALSAKATSSSDLEPQEGLLGDRSGGHLRALGRVLGDLADLGYDCQWHGLRASDIGAPHQRFRVFLLATRRDATAHDIGGGWRRRGSAQLAGASEDASGDGTRSGDATHPKDHGQPPFITGGHGTECARSSGRGEDAPNTPGDGRDQGRTESARQLRGPHAPLGSASTDWGPYAPAIAQWETLRGTAPAPTELNRNGKHRLSVAFTEWLMGLDPGWVDSVPGISRNDKLKALGNGVVPQQAAAALKRMLTQAPANTTGASLYPETGTL